LEDNIFYLAGGGTGYKSDGNIYIYSDYNDWYITPTSQSVLEGNSLSVNPQFIDTLNLIATNDTLAGAGLAIAGITTDIFGITRPNPPTISANEIKPGNIKAITALFNASESSCLVTFRDSSLRVGCGIINQWHWSFGDGESDTIQFPSHTYVKNGTYTVTLKINSSEGCSDSIIKRISINGCTTTSIQNFSSIQSIITFYPNPAASTLNIESTTNPIQSITVFDITGKEVYSLENLNTQNQSIPVANLPSGIYLIKAGFDNGSYMAKFMKE